MLYEVITALNLKRYEETPPLLLSEGEKRRLALALTLMQNGEHGILLDEPALGQDQHHKLILIDLLRKLSEAGFLVMFSTHDLELAAHADHLILISPDGIIAEGPTKQVMQDNNAWQHVITSYSIHYTKLYDSHFYPAQYCGNRKSSIRKYRSGTFLKNS